MYLCTCACLCICVVFIQIPTPEPYLFLTSYCNRNTTFNCYFPDIQPLISLLITGKIEWHQRRHQRKLMRSSVTFYLFVYFLLAMVQLDETNVLRWLREHQVDDLRPEVRNESNSSPNIFSELFSETTIRAFYTIYHETNICLYPDAKKSGQDFIIFCLSCSCANWLS